MHTDSLWTSRTDFEVLVVESIVRKVRREFPTK